jgi:hypothetical protein
MSFVLDGSSVVQVKKIAIPSSENSNHLDAHKLFV